MASLGTLIGSGVILSFGARADRVAGWLLSYAIGTLLGAALLGLFPEALEHAPPERSLWLLLASILVFLAFERALHWRHPHEGHHRDAHGVEPATAATILVGDAVHNAIDGLVIGVSFSVNLEVGVTSTLAILAHEIPQEIGDFAVLLQSGMPKMRALVLNYLVALTPVPAAALAYFWSADTGAIKGWLLPIAAGSFLYIALADLVPAVHHRRGRGLAIVQMLLIWCGVATIWTIQRFGHG